MRAKTCLYTEKFKDPMKVTSVGTFPVILVKLATVPSHSNKVEFSAKWVEMNRFLVTTLLGGVGTKR